MGECSCIPAGQLSFGAVQYGRSAWTMSAKPFGRQSYPSHPGLKLWSYPSSELLRLWKHFRSSARPRLCVDALMVLAIPIDDSKMISAAGRASNMPIGFSAIVLSEQFQRSSVPPLCSLRLCVEFTRQTLTTKALRTQRTHGDFQTRSLPQRWCISYDGNFICELSRKGCGSFHKNLSQNRNFRLRNQFPIRHACCSGRNWEPKARANGAAACCSECGAREK